MFKEEEHKTLTLEEGRKLMAGTSLAHLHDEDLQQVLDAVKTFCEICFTMQMSRGKKAKIFQLNNPLEENNSLSEAA